VNIVKRIVPELIADGKVEYPGLAFPGRHCPDVAKAMD
jgi:S1-C subfamily serine protease